MKKKSINKMFILMSLVFTFFTTLNVFAQTGNNWVLVRNNNVPENAFVGGNEADGTKTYVCRVRYQGIYLSGKALNGRCYVNSDGRERSFSRFRVLVGEYAWKKTSSYNYAVIGGGSDSENYYVCRVESSGEFFLGRTEGGRCYYTKNRRDYSSQRFELLTSKTRTKTILDAADSGRYEDLRDALEEGQAINLKNSDGKTALMIASEKGYSRIVQELLYERADFEVRDEKGNTALMYAALNGKSEVFRMLSSEGADLYARNNVGDNAFTLAASGGNSTIVRRILDNTGFETVGKEDLERGFRNAAQNGHENILQILLSAGVSVESPDSNGRTALMFAILGKRLDTARFLLKNDANVNAADEKGLTAFQHSVLADSERILKFFTDEVGIRSDELEAEKGLLLAAHYAKRTSLKYLLEKGVNVNAKDINDGFTPLMKAANEGHRKTTELLIKSGANLNLQNNEGKTALILATMNNRRKTLKLLVKSGADFNLRDNDGNTALSLAMQNKFKDIRKTLKKAGAKQ